MIKAIRAKLHGIRVTGADLDYHGSITLDPDICHQAGIYPLEFVEVWNKNTGARLSTYVIHGQAGSGCCVLNGAAARTCQPGDELILCAQTYLHSPDELCGLAPQVLTFNVDNTVKEHMQYAVSRSGAERYDFAVTNIDEG